MRPAKWEQVKLYFRNLLWPIRHQVRVIDGDTLEIDGETYRIEGIDTPEMDGPTEAERRLAVQARNYLSQLITNTGARAEILPDSGMYGRQLIRITVRGKSVSDLMIAKGYARAYSGRTKRRPWIITEDLETTAGGSSQHSTPPNAKSIPFLRLITPRKK